MDDRLIIVSSDSHAGMPKELWPEYLDPKFHDLIPGLHEDNAIYPVATGLLGARKTITKGALEEHFEIHQTGWHGLHDPVLRLADMDRESVAAEFVFHGVAGVPEKEIRLILGENTIRFLNLDAAHLGEIAHRIGFAIDEITGSGPQLAPELIESFDHRGGYRKPAEGDRRIPEIDVLLRDDLARAGVNAGAS